MFKYHSTEAGTNQVNYSAKNSKNQNLLYCFLQEPDNSIILYRCSKDGEPQNPVEITQDAVFELAPFNHPIEILVNSFIFSRHRKLAAIMKEAALLYEKKTSEYAKIISESSQDNEILTKNTNKVIDNTLVNILQNLLELDKKPAKLAAELRQKLIDSGLAISMGNPPVKDTDVQS